MTPTHPQGGYRDRKKSVRGGTEKRLFLAPQESAPSIVPTAFLLTHSMVSLHIYILQELGQPRRILHCPH